jgi:hypothetical protein
VEKKLRYWPASDGAAGSGRLDQNLGTALQDSYPTSGPDKMTNRTDLITMQRILKRCCVAALVLLVCVGLGPANWQPRSGLGWEIDHFVGYFVITLVFCIACRGLSWSREPSLCSRRFWRPCKLLHRIAGPILGRPSTAHAA